MTNGEMIQKVFDCEVCEPLPEDDIIHVIFPDKNDSAIGFDWSWWNAEYKEQTTKNDSPKYCERNICLKNEYNNVGCEDCDSHKTLGCLYYDPEEESFDYEECFRDSGGFE